MCLSFSKYGSRGTAVLTRASVTNSLFSKKQKVDNPTSTVRPAGSTEPPTTTQGAEGDMEEDKEEEDGFFLQDT